MANARRNEEGNVDQEVYLEVPPQDPPQAPIDPIVENVTPAKLKSYLQLLAQAMMAQSNRDVGPHVNPIVNSTTLRVRGFVKFKPLEFYGSKVEEDPKEFVDEMYRIFISWW